MLTCERSGLRSHVNIFLITPPLPFTSLMRDVSTFLMSLRQLQRQSGAYLMLQRRRPRLACGHELVPPSAQRLFKAMCSNTSPDPHQSHVYLKSLSAGKTSTC